jgi:hypothetical protein
MKQISNIHPDIKINFKSYNKVLSLLKSESNKKKPYSLPVRCLMHGLLTDEKHWINSNSDQLFSEFPEIFEACIGIILKLKKILFNS